MRSIDLIWQKYLEEGGQPDATAFGIWLIRNNPKIASGADAGSLQEASYPVEHDSMIGILVGRLERFLHFETKQVIKVSGLSSTDEFALMATLFFMGKTTKTQLLRQSLMEITTGSQMIKRMKDGGLVIEKANPDDGRSGIIELSAKGKKLLMHCFEGMRSIEGLTEGLDEKERGQLLHLLNKLDTSHSKKQQLKTIMDVMGGR